MEIIILDNLSHCARYIQFAFSLRKNSKRGILVLSIGWSVSNLLVECQGNCRSYLKMRLITMVNNHADSTFWHETWSYFSINKENFWCINNYLTILIKYYNLSQKLLIIKLQWSLTLVIRNPCLLVGVELTFLVGG